MISLICGIATFLFQIETAVTGACHESVTISAARLIEWPAAFVPVAELNDYQSLVASDVPFSLPGDARNPLSLALLVGVRSNDIGGNSPIDIASLVHIHNDPADQPAHCIRRSEDDGQPGDASALQACRAFVLEQLTLAGAFLDTLDVTADEVIPITLAFRGRIDVRLPRFGYYVGRALHAIEDSYAHALRDPATGSVRHVLNWIDATSDHYDLDRDGLAHAGELDDCRSGSAGAIDRTRAASIAAAAILSAASAPGVTGAERRERVESQLDLDFREHSGMHGGESILQRTGAPRHRRVRGVEFISVANDHDHRSHRVPLAPLNDSRVPALVLPLRPSRRQCASILATDASLWNH